MGNRLVPERRVNKLGHVVTKHVRDNDTPHGRKGLLATIAPSLDRKLAEKAERRELINHFGEALDHWHRCIDPRKYEYGYADRKQSYCNNLSKYSLEHLRYVASVCNTDDRWEDQDRVMQIITNRSGMEEWVVADLRYRKLFGDPSDHMEFLQKASLVEQYFLDDRFLTPSDEGTAEFHFNTKVVGFALRVHEYVMQSGGKIKLSYDNKDYFTPISEDLIEVLRDYPDREEDIFGFMTERYLVPCMVAGDMLREYLDSPRTPLRIGAL